MSEILGLNGRPVREPTHRGKDLVTKDQLMNAVLNAFGPLAATMKEVMARQMAVEDHLGFTYVAPTDAETQPPDQDGADGGDVEDGG